LGSYRHVVKASNGQNQGGKNSENSKIRENSAEQKVKNSIKMENQNSVNTMRQNLTYVIQKMVKKVKFYNHVLGGESFTNSVLNSLLLKIDINSKP
jgi:hypothetical protein